MKRNELTEDAKKKLENQKDKTVEKGPLKKTHKNQYTSDSTSKKLQ